MRGACPITDVYISGISLGMKCGNQIEFTQNDSGDISHNCSKSRINDEFEKQTEDGLQKDVISS